MSLLKRTLETTTELIGMGVDALYQDVLLYPFQRTKKESYRKLLDAIIQTYHGLWNNIEHLAKWPSPDQSSLVKETGINAGTAYVRFGLTDHPFLDELQRSLTSGWVSPKDEAAAFKTLAPLFSAVDKGAFAEKASSEIATHQIHNLAEYLTADSKKTRRGDGSETEIVAAVFDEALKAKADKGVEEQNPSWGSVRRHLAQMVFLLQDLKGALKGDGFVSPDKHEHFKMIDAALRS